jgi:thioredoxin 1
MANVVQITKDNFTSEVSGAGTPVLLDFGAEWCQPCKKLAPIVENLAQRYSGRLKVGYVDVGVSQNLAMEYRVMSVPTLLFFKSGAVVRQVVGARSAEELDALVQEVLA